MVGRKKYEIYPHARVELQVVERNKNVNAHKKEAKKRLTNGIQYINIIIQLNKKGKHHEFK